MPRLDPLPPEHTPELRKHFDFFLTTLGFAPNSVLTMQRKPKLVQAFAQLNAAVMDPQGKVDLGVRRLIGHLASKAAGCPYCQAHTVLGAENFGVAEARHEALWDYCTSALVRAHAVLGAKNSGVEEARLAALWDYSTSPLFSAKERVALDFALAAAAQPNGVTDELFAELRRHWDEEEIVEILGVVAMFGFLNR